MVLKYLGKYLRIIYCATARHTKVCISKDYIKDVKYLENYTAINT